MELDVRDYDSKKNSLIASEKMQEMNDDYITRPETVTSKFYKQSNVSKIDYRRNDPMNYTSESIKYS